VNCEFCGSTVLPGAKLCAACRSALKRARAEPSSVLQPLAKRAASTLTQKRKSRKAKAAGGDKAAAVIPPALDARRGVTPAVVGALAVVLCIIGYVVLQHGDHGALSAAPDAANAPAVSAAPATASPSASAPEGLTPLPPITLPPTVVPAAAEAEPVARPPGRAKRVARKAPVVPPMMPLPIEIAAPAAQPLPAPVAAAKPPPPDRRARVKNAFAQCASDDVLQQAFCEQRARIDLCEGLWGTAPQCPAQRDYGG
jgi:hypothetical protein